jgi:hypothetical protein
MPGAVVLLEAWEGPEQGGGYRLLLRRDGRTQAIGGLLALGFDSSSRRAGAALILGCVQRRGAAG